MTKRSRKNAFGKANVVRRSSLKTIPVLATDPLSRNSSTLRKNVRTTLLFGTALGTGLMAATTVLVMSTSPALACSTTDPGWSWNCGVGADNGLNWSGNGPFNSGNHPLAFGPFGVSAYQNLTIVTLGTVAIGENGNHGHGIGIYGRLQGSNYSPNQGFTWNVTTSNATTIQGGSVGVSDGIWIDSAFQDSTINIQSLGVQIGYAADPVANDGIHVNLHFSNGAPFASNHPTIDGINSLTINNSANIFADNHAIYTHANFYNQADPTLIEHFSNSGDLTSVSTVISHYNKQAAGVGGDATAGVTQTNSGTLTSTGTGGGIYIRTIADTAGGSANAYSKATNSGQINSYTDSIYSHAAAKTDYFGIGTGTGGVSIATVYVNNQVGGTLSSTNGEGIDGFASARANGYAYHAAGGTATATTTIINSDAINSHWDGIVAGADARARGFGSYSTSTNDSGSGTGGTAIAGLSITNSAAISNSHGESIDGSSYANAFGGGFHAAGGTASATTTISNTGALHSGWNDAIQASAKANASGYADTGGTATGGTATAAVVVNNTSADGTLFSLEHMGINAQSTALANAGYGSRSAPLTAVGGTANATTTITNAAEIAVEKDGIYGSANAQANAVATTSTSGGSATGGSAIAGVTITNSGKIWDVQTSDDGGGINGKSIASATANGFSAVGGYAKATTTIVNTPQINSFGDSIYGGALANTSAYGVDVKGSSASGGTAIANAVITNGTADALSSTNGMGIDGVVTALAKAGSSKTPSYTATGGTASATLSIANSSSIVSSGDGIGGTAKANANAYGSNTFTAYSKGQTAAATSYAYGACDDDPVLTCKTHTYPAVSHIDATLFSSGSATGGTAVADVVITNAGSISSINSEGIDGYAGAHASAYGFKAFGGTAKATLTITNAPPINSYGTGILGHAKADANGVGQYGHSYSYSGTGTGGTAVASVVISNGTADAITSTNGRGIDGYAGATANAEGFIALGGTAHANTDITNSSAITTLGQSKAELHRHLRRRQGVRQRRYGRQCGL